MVGGARGEKEAYVRQSKDRPTGPNKFKTEERRKELAKQCKSLSEEAKVAVRNARRDANNALDRMKKDDDLPEDEVKREQNNVQKLTDKFIEEVDKSLSAKEKELMEI